MTEALQLPTPESVQSACERFDQQHQLAESALQELFRLFPSNDDLNHVLLKVVAVNSLYGTCIFANEEVARHIHARHAEIDKALNAADPGVVDLIGHLKIQSRSHNFYSFATKYANCQQPQSYPIYDSRIDSYLWSLQQKNHFATFQHNDLCSYARFVEIMTAFRGFHHLGAFTFKQLDKFLHQHTEPVPQLVRDDRQTGPGAFDFFPEEDQTS
jgi:hypothetical protein